MGVWRLVLIFPFKGFDQGGRVFREIWNIYLVPPYQAQKALQCFCCIYSGMIPLVQGFCFGWAGVRSTSFKDMPHVLYNTFQKWHLVGFTVSLASSSA